jgi:UDP-N-acetylenolpyruvoylglucosamine reductase
MSNEPPDWKDAARRLLLQLLRAQPTATAEDLRIYAAEQGLENPHHHNCWGSVFTTAHRDQLIEPCGYRKNAIHSAHARMVTIWRLQH